MDAGIHKKQFVCCTPDDLSQYLWTSGPDARFGLGPYLVADGKFYILDDTGTLTMARVSLTGFEPLARAKVLEDRETWGPLAVAGDRLLARGLTRLVCIDIGKAD